jgi:hypothetical protein
METKKNYTESELGQILIIETELRTIFNRSYIPTILVYKANSLLAKWKMLTGWKERTDNPIQEPILDETRRHSESSSIS